ncbi:MAG: hypothetical protein BroJett025_07470 [Patescibacteria group bacterium]|nr:MAG: hypothetical protein BroJett025_07470 [Patescibacteria group bacterium]
MDRDIDFSNEAFHKNLGFPNAPEISPRTGMVTNKFSPGTALFWIPGFVLGQTVALASNTVVGGTLFLVDGYGLLPQLSVSVTAVCFSVLGLWFVFKTMSMWFSKKVTIFTTILLFCSTQLFYYTAIDPVNSHSISFLLSALLFYQISRVLHSRITWKNVIPMGVTAGFLMLVRNQDLVVVLPIFITLFIVQKESLLHKLNWAILFSGSAFVVMGIQFLTTVTLFGVLGSPYLMRGEQLNWFKPDFIRVLFTLENGLFFFAPVLGFAVLFLIRKLKEKVTILGTISLIAFLLQLYVVASWGPEIIGGPYGSRMFVSVLPQLSIAVAYFIDFLLKKLQKKQFVIVFLVLLLFFSSNMLLQTLIMLYRF